MAAIGSQTRPQVDPSGSDPSRPDSITIVDNASMQDTPSDDGSVNSEFQREAYGPEEGEKGWDKYEVRLAPDDPGSPYNWPIWKRSYITALAGVVLFNATFASSAPSGVILNIEQHFGFSSEVGSLLISLFVAGYCVGPLLWGPLSEQYGRRPIFVATFIVYTGLQVGCALSPNTGAILTFRFLSGVFAAAPLTNSGAVISDIWDANARGKALGIFTLAPFAGPALAPVVSGFMSVRGVSWRWIFWVLTIFAGACLVLIIFTMPETHTPALVVQRAKKLRKETGDERYWAPLEKEKFGFIARMEKVVSRPFKILFREPMLIAITMYMSFIYGCIYLLFEAFPIVFMQGHHFNPGVSGLMYLPIFIGGVLAVAGYIWIWNPRYTKLAAQLAPERPPPEVRLEQAMVAGPIFAISFFWFGWTSYPSISFWAPLFAVGAMGFSILWIFLALFNYIIDAYLFVAASALASSTVIRSLFGAGFPLFATQMYETLNPRWASTLLGCIAALLAPIPFVLRTYGPVLRRKSKYAPTKPPAPKDEEAKTEA